MPKKIEVPAIHGWDPVVEEFVDIDGCTLVLEHSLLSLQKWESKWHKPYLSDKEKTSEEIIDYIRCMTIKPIDVNPDIYYHLSSEAINEITEYIENPMTATTFSNNKMPGSRGNSKEIITAEIIYYWMIALNIPMDYRKWHLNQLLTLIRVCEIKSDTNGKKMSKNEVAAKNRALNAQRRAKLHTHG